MPGSSPENDSTTPPEAPEGRIQVPRSVSAADQAAKVRKLCLELGLTRAPYSAIWRLLRLDSAGRPAPFRQ